ncbi:hypothetical protein [Streptomyces sp. NBC_01589]|uniref:hypothetical protein n=1 Tax=unclassified Streptomyces TaxID=2593676 RepID=UPI0038656E92
MRAGKRLDLGIFSECVKGAPDTGRITGSTPEVSFDDGVKWTSVELDGVRGKSAVWAGSVKQEIIRAVGVRK